VHFLLAERHGDAQNAPFARRIHPAGDQNSRIMDLAVQTHLFVTGFSPLTGIQVISTIDEVISDKLTHYGAFQSLNRDSGDFYCILP